MRREPSSADLSVAPGAIRWTPRTSIARAIEVLREEGLRSLLAGALGETVYRRLALLERDLALEMPPVETSGLSFRWLDASDLSAYEVLRPGRRDQAATRLAAGDRCFATWLDGRLVAVRWLATGAPHVEYLGLRLPLDSGDVYHYDTYTDSAFRRRGISALSQQRLFTILRAEGYRRAIRAVLPENRAGVRDAARAGYATFGRIGFVRIGPWRRAFVRRNRTKRRVEPAA